VYIQKKKGKESSKNNGNNGLRAKGGKISNIESLFIYEEILTRAMKLYSSPSKLQSFFNSLYIDK